MPDSATLIPPSETTTNQSCGLRLTPEQMIRTLYEHFVAGRGTPAIAADGTPQYAIGQVNRTGEYDRNGCAIFVLAGIRPEIQERLRQIGAHGSCGTADLPEKGIDLSQLITLESSRATGFEKFSNGDVRATSLQIFFDRLQGVHDTAARAFHQARQGALEPRDIATARAVFAEVFAFELWSVSRHYGITIESVLLDIANASRQQGDMI